MPYGPRSASSLTSPVTQMTAFILFRVGLLRRMGIRKRRDRHAGVIDAHDSRIGIEHTVEGLGRRHLCNEADVRYSRPIAMAEPAARGVLGEQRLDGIEPGAEPMLNPG